MTELSEKLSEKSPENINKHNKVILFNCTNIEISRIKMTLPAHQNSYILLINNIFSVLCICTIYIILQLS